ncbi:MAG TPA: hypothetical protein VNQ76_07725 [Planctomicrobium sp.]|nr:hypothetical protein [Planctomicrobium sp.]
MLPCSATIRLRSGGRKLVCLLLLVSFFASFVPLPGGSAAPANSSEKDRSQPFPCQNRPCGCRSAEQCWKKCCCFTNAQKLAWAEKNRVKVPKFVLKQAENEQSQIAAVSTNSQSSCCSGSGKKQCQSGTCSDNNEPKSSVIIGIFAQQCQGNGFYWNSLPWIILPIIDDVTFSETLVTSAFERPTLLPASIFYQPPVPPPRSA